MNATKRTQEIAHRCPHPFGRVDMHFADAIAVIVTRPRISHAAAEQPALAVSVAVVSRALSRLDPVARELAHSAAYIRPFVLIGPDRYIELLEQVKLG